MSSPPETTTTPDPRPSTLGVRPVAISIICIFGFFGAFIAIPMVFSNAARNVGLWYPPYLAVSAAVVGACMFGLWKMRLWSILLYTVFSALNQVVLLATGHWNASAIAIPGIVIVLGFAYFSRMR
jgi:hypothetical protein